MNTGGGEQTSGLHLTEGPTYEVDAYLLFRVLETLRLAPIYALLGSAYEDELPDDFKPHKWRGCEGAFADDAVRNYRDLIAAMTRAREASAL